MAETITIPTPHVPYGPEGVPVHIADATYLRHAVRNIRYQARGERLWGSNLTNTIVKLLNDAADSLNPPSSHDHIDDGSTYLDCSGCYPEPTDPRPTS